jgi:hypothetical protein
MATEAQVAANRLNARKSTGPRTDDGKAAVAQNAVRHGLLAQQAVIGGEDPGEFEFYRDQMLGELSPAGAMEAMLADRVVGLAWRLRRAERIQAEVFDSMLTEDATSPVRKLLRSMQAKGASEGPAETALGRVVARDFANSRVLDRLGLYERRIEHSLYRTMTELQKLRLLRELEEPTRAASEGNHRQAELDAATQPVARTEEQPLRQTKPISPLSAQKTWFEGQNKANQSQFQGVLTGSGGRLGENLRAKGAGKRYNGPPASVGNRGPSQARL